MKLNTTARIIAMCVLVLYIMTFTMSLKQIPVNGLLITTILGIFMAIGVWENKRSYRHYKYSEGWRICSQIAFLSIFYVTIFSVVIGFVRIIIGAAFDIETVSNYINNFTSVLPYLIINIIVVISSTFLLLFIIPLFFLTANRNEEVLEDEFKS